MWPGGSSVPLSQMLCSLNQSSGSRARSPILLERGAMIKWELSTGGSLPSPTSEGLVAAAAANPAYQFDQQLWSCHSGGSMQLQRAPRQQPSAAQPAASARWLPWRLIFHEQVKRPALTAPQQWLGPRLFASSEEAHPGCLTAHRLVGEIPSIGGGSSTSSCWVEDSGQISFGRASHSALVAGGVGSVGSSSPAQLDRQLRWTLTRWRGDEIGCTAARPAATGQAGSIGSISLSSGAGAWVSPSAK
ncbi:hypothetical protein THAOC_12621, partial [Thalassiosira oceanica]